jgi:hypothetical protein
MAKTTCVLARTHIELAPQSMAQLHQSDGLRQPEDPGVEVLCRASPLPSSSGCFGGTPWLRATYQNQHNTNRQNICFSGYSMLTARADVGVPGGIWRACVLISFDLSLYCAQLRPYAVSKFCAYRNSFLSFHLNTSIARCVFLLCSLGLNREAFS